MLHLSRSSSSRDATVPGHLPRAPSTPPTVPAKACDPTAPAYLRPNWDHPRVRIGVGHGYPLCRRRLNFGRRPRAGCFALLGRGKGAGERKLGCARRRCPSPRGCACTYPSSAARVVPYTGPSASSSAAPACAALCVGTTTALCVALCVGTGDGWACARHHPLPSPNRSHDSMKEEER